jgi:hypothetical protein
MVNLRKCLLDSILLFYLIGMILGHHPRLSLVVRILVRLISQLWEELMIRNGTAGIDDGKDCDEVEIKAWLLQPRRLSQSM